MSDNNLSALMDSDTGLAELYLETVRRSEHLEPEKILVLAVLQDAIHCFRKFSKARARAGRKQFQEAQSWIMGADNDSLFGFASVCEILGLNPQYLRRGLLEWRNAQLTINREKSTKREGLRRRAA